MKTLLFFSSEITKNKMHFLIENQRYKKWILSLASRRSDGYVLWNLDDNNYDEICDKLLVFVVTDTEDMAGSSAAAIIHMECAAIQFPHPFS